MVILTWITVVILELIHAPKPDFLEGLCLLVAKPPWRAWHQKCKHLFKFTIAVTIITIIVTIKLLLRLKHD